MKKKPDVTIGTMIETPAGRDPRRRDRRRGRLLQLRHQRPHADDVRLQPRRRREPDDARLPRAGPAEAQPVRDDRPGRRRRAGAHRRASGAGRPSRASSSACAASTAATRSRSTCSTRPASTTCRCSPVPGADRPARRGPGGDPAAPGAPTRGVAPPEPPDDAARSADHAPAVRAWSTTADTVASPAPLKPAGHPRRGHRPGPRGDGHRRRGQRAGRPPPGGRSIWSDCARSTPRSRRRSP